MNNKVLVTGYGLITAAGESAEETWKSIQTGRTGIGPITHWDTSAWTDLLGGEIKDYDPKRLYPDRKLLKLLSRQDVLGLNAAIQGVEHSQLIPWRDQQPDTETINEKVGIFVGSPGNKFYQQYDYLPLLAQGGGNTKIFAEKLQENVHPMWLLKTLPNNVLAYTGIRYGFKGPNQNIANHAVSGVQAILEAYHAIRSGQIDRAVVVAYDYGIAAQEQMYYQGTGLLSKTQVHSFDVKRDGTVMGEGAGALVLEASHAATERGAAIYGEVLGGGTVSEGEGILSQTRSGEGLKTCILNTLRKAGLTEKDVGMIAAHANGTRVSDASEAAAILSCFQSSKVPVTGFKWATGHTLTAAGVIESILMLLALRKGSAPGIPTLNQKDPEFEHLPASALAQPVTSSVGLLISRAFYSLNSALLLKVHSS